MFVFTAKINKKAVAAAIILLALSICLLLLGLFLPGGGTKEVFALSSVVKTNEERVSYLRSLGWEVSPQPVDTQEIVIPDDFSGVYGDYNELQLSQGFDLRDFSGFDAVRYTYSVLNYPGGEENVVADLIIYRNEVIAGDVQSAALDGFMSGLEYPSSPALKSPDGTA